MDGLHELLRAKRSEIIARWGAQVAANAPDDLTRAELVDHVPAFIDQVIAALPQAGGRAAAAMPLPDGSPVAAKHGKQRLRSGFDLYSVVREYGILSNCILVLARESRLTLTISEVVTLTDRLNTGIAEATSAYVETRQQRRDEPFRLLVESVKDYAIFLLDREGKVASWNAGAERITGYRAEEMIGRSSFLCYPPEAVEAGTPHEALERARVDGRVEEEAWQLRKDGSRFYADLAITALHDENRALVGFAKVTRDITERKRFEKQEERLHLTELFVGVLGHDLKNPLNAIVTSAALLLRRWELPEPAMKTAVRIANSADRMARLIDQLLDFTRARLGGGLPIVRRRTDLRDVCRRAADELEISNGRVIRCEVTGGGIGDWDADRLAQVLSNLGHNAIQYGKPDSPIWFRARDVDGDAILEVHNEGTPIAPALLPVIFDPFRRGGGGAGVGLGLGLYIVRAIALAHGGSIDVESSEGKGTTFRLRLPKRAPR